MSEWKKRITIHKRRIPASQVRLGPVGISDLTPEQSARLYKVWQVLRCLELEKDTFEHFETDFSRDIHPEREILLWENLAARLKKVKTTKRAKEVFRRWLEDCPPIVVE